MKKRAWYRPAAPLMLADVASMALENYKTTSHLGDCMLGVWRVKPAFQDSFVGCLHQDGTVRAQVLKPSHVEQRELVDLLTLLKPTFAILRLINTFFTEKGKPIVQSQSQATAQTAALGIDHLWHIPAWGTPSRKHDLTSFSPRFAPFCLGRCFGKRPQTIKHLERLPRPAGVPP